MELTKIDIFFVFSDKEHYFEQIIWPFDVAIFKYEITDNLALARLQIIMWTVAFNFTIIEKGNGWFFY